MSLHQRAPYETAGPERKASMAAQRERADEEMLAGDVDEQVRYGDEGDDAGSLYGPSGGPGDMQAQLVAAATPLEYGASLETKFASYDNYCALFHYILNSDAPVDLEVPTVGRSSIDCLSSWL